MLPNPAERPSKRFLTSWTCATSRCKKSIHPETSSADLAVVFSEAPLPVNELVAFCSVVAQLTHPQNGTMFTATQKPGEVFLLTVSLAFLQTGSPLRMMTPTGPFLLPPPLDFLALLVWNKIQTLKRFGLLDLLELRVVLKTHGTHLWSTARHVLWHSSWL